MCLINLMLLFDSNQYIIVNNKEIIIYLKLCKIDLIKDSIYIQRKT